MVGLVLLKFLGSFLIEELWLGLRMPVETEVVLGVQTDAGVI